MPTIRLVTDPTRTEIVSDDDVAAYKAPVPAAGQPAVVTQPAVTTAIAITVSATCGQCHVGVPVNAIATEVQCPDCNQRLALDWPLWREVLSGAVEGGPSAAPNQDHLEALTPASAKTALARNYVRKDAQCARCKARLPLPRALVGAEHGFCICVYCGDKISLRKTPPELAQLAGVTHVIGEEIAALAGTASTRQRLFYLWHERKVQAAVAGASENDQFHWKRLDDVVCDRHGNMYFLSEQALWSVDALFKSRWQRGAVTAGNERLEDPELSVTPNGFMILRAKNRHQAQVLSCADGSPVASLGGREPPNATAHGFDPKDCDSLTCDIDGTILGVIHDRLLRWTYDGQPLDTWPVTGTFQRHPYELCAKNGGIHVGFDGMLIVRQGEDLAKLDRQGKLLWRASMPKDQTVRGRVQSDAHGNTYVLCEGAHGVRQIVRISALGQVDWAIDGTRPGTPAWDGRHLVVLPHGTMYVFDRDGSARAFNADGSLRFASPRAREADQESVKRRDAAAR